MLASIEATALLAKSTHVDGRSAAARDCTKAASHHTVMLTSFESVLSAKSTHGDGQSAAARDCTKAASHHTVMLTSIEASAARIEHAR